MSDFKIIFPNQESSSPSDDTVVIIKSNFESSNSFMYSSGSVFHKGAITFKFNFEQIFSNLSF